VKIIVQKFGGTSVKDDRGRKLALSHIQEAVNEGYKAVVVVSAMGRKGDPYATDSLLDLLYGGQDTITEHEQDIAFIMRRNDFLCCVRQHAFGKRD
jgi:aspartate kinase